MQFLTTRETIKTEWSEKQKAKKAYIKQHLQFSKRLRYLPTIIKTGLRLLISFMLGGGLYILGMLDGYVSKDCPKTEENTKNPIPTLPKTGGKE